MQGIMFIKCMPCILEIQRKAFARKDCNVSNTPSAIVRTLFIIFLDCNYS